MLRDKRFTWRRRYGERHLSLSIASVSLLIIILMTACSREGSADLFERGEVLLGDGDHMEALEIYRSLANKFPESAHAPSARYRIGMIHYLHTGHLKKALDAYLSLILLYPESEEIALARGDMAEIYRRNGEHRKAIGEYQWLVEHSKGAERDAYRYNIAMEYQNLSDFKQAVIEIEDILKNSPSDKLLPKLYYQLGSNQYLDGDTEGAMTTYDTVIEEYSNDPLSLEATLGKAVILEEMGRLREAAALLRSLIEVYPNRDAIEVRLKWVKKRTRERASRRRQ